jgi:hypothetical protein
MTAISWHAHIVSRKCGRSKFDRDSARLVLPCLLRGGSTDNRHWHENRDDASGQPEGLDTPDTDRLIDPA